MQRGWLSSLLSLIENDEKIGMVGSKLVYPNGLLQEAGGIFGMTPAHGIMAVEKALWQQSLIM